MGNAHGHVINDTEERYRILSFNFGDEIRHEPAHVYDIEPFQTIPVSAEMCPVRGLIVSTGVANSGKHIVLKPNEFVKISTLLKDGDDNPVYEEAKHVMAQAASSNLPSAEARERYVSVFNRLKEEAREAQKKYNRRPVRVFQQGVMEAVQSSIQQAETMRIQEKSSSEPTKTPSTANKATENAAIVTPSKKESNEKKKDW